MELDEVRELYRQKSSDLRLPITMNSDQTHTRTSIVLDNKLYCTAGSASTVIQMISQTSGTMYCTNRSLVDISRDSIPLCHQIKKKRGKKEKGKRVLTLCIRLLLSVQSTIRSHHGLRVPHRRVLQIRVTSTVFAAFSLAQRAGGRDLDRFIRRGSGVLERGEEGLGGFGGEVLVVVVVDLHHGGVDTGTETFDFDEGEQAVFGSVAGGNA